MQSPRFHPIAIRIQLALAYLERLLHGSDVPYVKTSVAHHNADLAELLRLWLGYRQTHDETPGLAASLTIDGEYILEDTWGVADIETGAPVNANTVFRIASISKLFTAVGVMRLVESRDIHLDASVAGYLPWFRSQGRSQAEQITVRDLLMHGGGLKRDGNTDHQQSRDFPDAAGLRRDFDSGVVAFPPRQRFKYSNYGYAVLGLLIEAVAGMSFAEYQKTHVFDPLDMSNTSTDWREDMPTNVTRGYSRRRNGAPRTACPAYALSGYAASHGLCTSLRDLSGFAQAILDHSLLSPEATAMMFTGAWANAPEETAWGLGFRTFGIDGRKVVGSRGEFEGYESMLVIDPGRRVAAIVLANAQSVGGTELGKGLIHATNKTLDLCERSPASEVRLTNLTGLYSSLWRDRLIAPIGSRLYAFSPLADRLFDAPSETSMTNDHVARIDSDSPSGYVDESAVFDLGPDGRARSVRIGGITSPRLADRTA